MAFDADGSVLVGQILSARIARLDRKTGAISTYVDFDRGVLGVDDITSDGRGTCWTSCATGMGGESVFRIDRGGRVQALYSGLTGANGIQFDRRRGRLFVGQYAGGNALYEIDPMGRTEPRLVTRQFATTNAMDLDAEGNILLTVAGGRIARVHPDSGQAELLEARFPHNSALKVDSNGQIYVSGYEAGVGVLWRLSPDGREVETLTHGGLPPIDNLLLAPSRRLLISTLRDATVLELDIDDGCRQVRAYSPAGNPSALWLAHADGGLFMNDGMSIRRHDAERRAMALTSGSYYARNGFPFPGAMCAAPGGGLYLASGMQSPLANAQDSRVFHVDTSSFACRPLTTGTYHGVRLPSAVCADEHTVYVTEFLSGDVVALDAGGNETRKRTVARQLAGPLGVVLHEGTLFVAESLGQRISTVDLETGRQDVLVTAGLGRPTALALDTDGFLLVIDAHGKRLLRVDRVSGAITELADRLPVYPVMFSNWPLVGAANGLSVGPSGVIHVAGNEDGSLWAMHRAH